MKKIKRKVVLKFLAQYEIMTTPIEDLKMTLESDYLDGEGESKEYESIWCDDVQDFLVEFYINVVNFGVTNNFLEQFLVNLRVGQFEIEGDEPTLNVCTCCNYHSVFDAEAYEICPVCFWQNTVSFPKESELKCSMNGMAINVARANFKMFGASSIKSLEFVDPRGKEKYRLSS